MNLQIYSNRISTERNHVSFFKASIPHELFFPFTVLSCVGDPDPDIFCTFQTLIHWSEVRIRILPFYHKGVDRTEIMLAK
jgi:hypothetical protein